MIDKNKRLKLIKRTVRKTRRKSGRKPQVEINLRETAPQEWDLREELELMGTRLKG